jgi:hypothetical protein
MMRQTGRQVAVSLIGHGHGGLELIGRWRPTGVGARSRRKSVGEAGLGTVGVTLGCVAGGSHHHGGLGPVAAIHGSTGRHHGGVSLSSG